MCVIAIVEDQDHRPSKDEIQAMWDHNPHGAGIAWRADGKIHWKKGLTLDQVQVMASEVPAPFIVHFRIPSCGGNSPSLAHPFPVTPTANPLMEGSTDKFAMLFHNGHWANWEHQAKTMVAQAGGRVKVPTGKWSDTRAMAFLAGNFGLGMLEWIGEKTVDIGAKEDELDIFGTGWKSFNGYIVSNDYWTNRIRRSVPVAPVGDPVAPKPGLTEAEMKERFPHLTAPASLLPPVTPGMFPGMREHLRIVAGKGSPKAATGGSHAADPFDWVKPKQWMGLTPEHQEWLMKEARRRFMVSKGKPKHERLISQTQYKAALKSTQRIQAEQANQALITAATKDLLDQPVGMTTH